jgi:hypothetical protein
MGEELQRLVVLQCGIAYSQVPAWGQNQCSMWSELTSPEPGMPGGSISVSPHKVSPIMVSVSLMGHLLGIKDLLGSLVLLQVSIQIGGTQQGASGGTTVGGKHGHFSADVHSPKLNHPAALPLLLMVAVSS